MRGLIGPTSAAVAVCAIALIEQGNVAGYAWAYSGETDRMVLVKTLTETQDLANWLRAHQPGRIDVNTKDVGINFKFGGKTGNTRDSHRLIQLGKSKSPAIQTRVVEELFAAYFENEGDITSHAVLTSAGVKAGLDEKEVKEWLASDKGGKEVDLEVEQAQQNQISGVPNFTIQGKYEVGGAQDPGVFLRLFEKIRAEQASKA